MNDKKCCAMVYPSEIKYQTGLPEKRCKEIKSLFDKVYSEVKSEREK